jgi:hypothetical protein
MRSSLLVVLLALSLVASMGTASAAEASVPVKVKVSQTNTPKWFNGGAMEKYDGRYWFVRNYVLAYVGEKYMRVDRAEYHYWVWGRPSGKLCGGAFNVYNPGASQSGDLNRSHVFRADFGVCRTPTGTAGQWNYVGGNGINLGTWYRGGCAGGYPIVELAKHTAWGFAHPGCW